MGGLKGGADWAAARDPKNILGAQKIVHTFFLEQIKISYTFNR